MPSKRYSLRGIGHEKQAAGVLAVVPGVAGPGLAGAQVRQPGAIGNASQQQVAAGVFVVDIDLGHGDVGAVGNGDTVLGRGHLQHVVVHGGRLAEGGIGGHGGGKLRRFLRQGLAAELQGLDRLPRQQGGDVKFVALPAPGEGDVGVLHAGGAGVLHADAEHVGHGLVAAVLHKQAGVAPGADDLQVIADGHAVQLGGLRGQAVLVGLGGLLFAAPGAQQHQGQQQGGALDGSFHTLLLCKEPRPMGAGLFRRIRLGQELKRLCASSGL